MSYRHTRDWKALAIIGVLGFPLYILASCAEANAQTVDGNMLHSQCQSGHGFDTPYIVGVMGGLNQSGSQQFCLPMNSNGRQYRDVVCKGLVDHPEYRAFDASVLTHAFLAEAFPCQ